MKAGTLKTVNLSSIIKISGVVDREEELTPDLYEELSKIWRKNLSRYHT